MKVYRLIVFTFAMFFAVCVSGQVDKSKTLVVLSNQDGQLAYNKGITEYNKRDFTSAEQNFETALKYLPTSDKAFYNLGLTQLALNNNDEKALENFESAINHNQQSADYYLGRAIANARNRNYKQALDDIDKAAEIGNTDQDLAYFRGMVYLLWGKPELAVAQYNKAIDSNIEFMMAYCDRGKANLMAGKPKAAIDDYNRAAEISPNTYYIYMFRADAKAANDDMTGALNDLDKAVELTKDSTIENYYAKNARGLMLVKNNQYKKAMSEFNELIEKFPQETGAPLNIAYIEYQKGDYVAAEKAYTEIIRKNENCAQAYYNRAFCKELQFKFDSACKDYKKAKELGLEFKVKDCN